jgi:molybdate transport system substrate-binding protein
MGTRLSTLTAIVALVAGACASAGTMPPTAAPVSAAPPANPAPTAASAVTAPPASLTVYGAASLTAALAKVKAAYEAANPGATITLSTDSSSALETKIEQGAPADVFLSADTANAQKLVDKGLAAGGVTVFAGNLLAIIVPAANPAGIKDPTDLARAGIKVIACGDTVPITQYAAQLIANLGKLTGYPVDYAARYAANIVSKEANVTAVVTKVGLGEGDAGIAYVTDALASTKVQTIEVPDRANVPASYGGVVVKASKSTAAAAAFLAWLTGKDGQAVLAGFGFRPPS